MGDIGSPTHPHSHVLSIKTWVLKTWEVVFLEKEKKEKKEINVEGGGANKKRDRKEKKRDRREKKKKIGKEEGREREEKKGFCILMRLSSSALTKVLSWSD